MFTRLLQCELIILKSVYKIPKEGVFFSEYPLNSYYSYDIVL